VELYLHGPRCLLGLKEVRYGFKGRGICMNAANNILKTNTHEGKVVPVHHVMKTLLA
jgi:hypothetical protein